MSQDFSSQPTIRHQAVGEATVPHQAVDATVPNQRVQASPPAPIPSAKPDAHPRLKPKKARGKHTLIIVSLVLMVLTMMTAFALVIGALVLFNSGVLPGVSVAGVDLGGLSRQEATTSLENEWQTLTLKDIETGQTWAVPSEQLGITINAPETASKAYAQGRDQGDLLSAITGVELMPVLNADFNQLRNGLDALRPEIDTPAQNAGVQFIGGVVQERPPQNGRLLDLEATLSTLTTPTISDRVLDLIFTETYPVITDASAMVAEAQALLSNPLNIRAFDPVTGNSVYWQAQPQTWANWLTATSDNTQANGLRLSLNAPDIENFLRTESAVLDASRYLNMPQAVEQVQSAISNGQTSATVRVYHNDRTHTVQAGETIISIAWDYGVPYPWVQQANPGTDTLAIGQQITIPSPDNFFYTEPVVDKRIVVSISQQRTRVYENGQLKWDWLSSTGVNDSPTWNGVYQIISHVDNAYAANWNLWMPYFMGVYQPIPGSEFTNGFHGFPTRGGGQILWTNNLGSKVTYGCIMLSDANAAQLYQWAENGVIVEITK